MNAIRLDFVIEICVHLIDREILPLPPENSLTPTNKQHPQQATWLRHARQFPNHHVSSAALGRRTMICIRWRAFLAFSLPGARTIAGLRDLQSSLAHTAAAAAVRAVIGRTNSLRQDAADKRPKIKSRRPSRGRSLPLPHLKWGASSADASLHGESVSAGSCQRLHVP